MKTSVFVLLLLLPMYFHGEIVTVPKYNYSVFPLEGWELQEYESEAELSWISHNNGVSFTVRSWIGDTYSDIREMFTDLTSGLDATGNCVVFSYLDRDSAIGEVEVILNNVKYKGWIVFIEGSGFDYYISGFSLVENYKELYSEIQSAIDSFAIGREGAYMPGPITTFLDATPNKSDKEHNVDFFNNKLKIISSDVSTSSSQTLIEREAEIMKGYSHDPERFYNAWKRYYKLIFRDSYSRLDGVYNALYPYLGNNKYSDYDLTELLMFWIQGYTYRRDLSSASDLLNPLEASLSKTGDCDARSLILGILLHKFNIDSILLASEKVKHAMLAVDIPGEGAKFTHEDKDYLTIELTAKALIGEIKKSMADPSLWTVVEMEYESGF